MSAPALSTTPDAGDVAELRRLYEKADCFAREIAEFRAEISIPAHNQLRYAGHHFLQAINDDIELVDEEQLRRAKNHCERAMYEAAEAGIISALDSIRAFRQDYKDIVVSDVLGSYTDKLVLARKAQDLLARGRADQASAVTRVSEYMNTFRELRAAAETLEAARDDLNAKVMAQVRETRRFALRLLVTVLGIVGAIVLGIWRVVATMP